MRTEEMLETMARKLGVDGFGMTQNGCKQLVFDEEIVVSIEEALGKVGLWIATEIVRLPEENREVLFRSLLRSNVLAARDQEPVLVVSEDRVFLQYFIRAESCTPESLISSLERFVNKADSWKKKLSKNQDVSREHVQFSHFVRGNMLRP